jgi:hypothetical protein
LCLWLGWAVYRARSQADAVQSVVRMGGWISYDYEYAADHSAILRDPVPHGPAWFTNIFGLHYLNNVVVVCVHGEEVTSIECLRSIKKLRSFSLIEANVTDLEPLAGLTELTSLSVMRVPVSDIHPLSELTNLTGLHLGETRVHDIAPLAGLVNLQGLHLNDTEVSDTSPLANLTNLKVLDLRNTNVEDVSPLCGLAKLEGLTLLNTKVTKAEIDKLRLALPDCTILWSPQE